jgi:diguanylate cyclase (GGDEF)-like protein
MTKVFNISIIWLNHLFGLFFENTEYEQKFHRLYLQDNFSQNKIAIVVGLSVYLLYIPLAYFLTPDDIYVSASVILLLPVLFSIIFLSIFNKEKWAEYRPFILFLYSIIISLPPIIVMYFTHSHNYNIYIANMGPPFVAIFVGIGIGFSIALLANTLIIVLIAVTFFYLHVSIVETLHNLLLLNALFLLSAIGSYTHERSKRVQYMKQFKELELIRQTITDALTGLKNRRYLDTIKMHGGHVVSVMMMDIDYFKRFNDTYGHQAGDEVLKAVSGVLIEHFQDYEDYVFRYGGEEFLVILYNVDAKKAKDKAETLLQKVRDLGILHVSSDAAETVTLSIGIASDSGTGPNIEEMIRLADEKLYESKNHGRNRVTI